MIQIVTNRKKHFDKWNMEKVSAFGSPMAFDAYTVNIIDLADESLWYNKGSSSDQVEIRNDLISLKGIINASKSSKCVIVLPQNCVYHYHFGYTASGRTQDYLESRKLKDMLLQVKGKILEPLLPVEKYPYTLSYENNITLVNGVEYVSAFYFSGAGESASLAKDSNKATTIQFAHRVYLTTLDTFESELKLIKYLQGIRILPLERSQYPEWLTQMAMFNDIELVKEVKACEFAIQELINKKEVYGAELIENLKYKSILCTNGAELVKDVFRILQQILACDLSEFIDEKKEDFRIELDSVVLIGEIKGVTSNIKSEHISQVDVHVQGYYDEAQEKGLTKAAKAVLIMNPFRNKPIDQREPVHEIQLRLAKRNDCLIIETITLLRIFERFRKNELTIDQIIDKIVNTSGLLKIEDFDDVMEGKENEV